MASNKKLSAIITIGGAVASSLGSAFGAIRGETQKVGAAVQQLTSRQRELNSMIAKAGRDGVQGGELRLHYAQKELDLIGKQIAALKRRQSLEDAQAANRAKRSEIGGQIGSTLATGASIAVPLGAAVKEAADFDYELQLIGNTADMTKAQIGSLRSSILDDSRKVGQSATNMQKGMGFLIAAGMDAGLASQFLQSIGKTATATASDIEDLSKMVFTLNDSLKITPQGMQGAIDTLAQAGKEGNVELRDMAKQLPVLASGFVSLKMEGREAAATMGAALQIARKGAADADEAANNMKNFIAKIMSPETLKKAKKEFGLDLYGIITAAQKKGRNPFEASMEAIIKATKGDQKKIGELFQDMQVQNFIRPMIQQWDKYKEIKDKALKSNGVIDRDFQKMRETTKQQMAELGNAFGRLGIAIGSALTASSGAGSTGLAARIDQLAELIAANKEVAGTGIKVVGGLFAMRLGWLGMKYAWTMAKGAWLGLQAAMLAAPARLAAVGTALRGVGTAVMLVGRAVLTTPLGLILGGIALAGALIYKYWQPLGAFFGSFFPAVGAALAPIGKAFTDAFAPVWNVIGPVVMPVLNTVGGWVRQAVDWFTNLFTPIDKASETTKAFGEAGKACGEVIGTAFRIMLTPIEAVLTAIKWINGNIGGVIDKAVQLGGAVGSKAAQWGAKAANFLGVGDSPAPAAPQLPPMAQRGGGSVTDNSQTTIHITQQPGQDAKALADEIERRQRQRAGVRARSSLVDGVGAQ